MLVVDSLKIRKEQKIKIFYQNELDEACFLHDMANGDFKNLNRKTRADKVS